MVNGTSNREMKQMKLALTLKLNEQLCEWNESIGWSIWKIWVALML